VYDGNWGDDAWMLKTGLGQNPSSIEYDNNGYGIDVAALDNYTRLPWTILSTPGGDYNKLMVRATLPFLLLA